MKQVLQTNFVNYHTQWSVDHILGIAGGRVGYKEQSVNGVFISNPELVEFTSLGGGSLILVICTN